MSGRDFHEEFQDNARVTRALRLAARDAIWRHKALGVPIAIWQDGKVVIVPPEEIVVPEHPDEDRAGQDP